MKTTKSVLGKALLPAVVVLTLGIFIGLGFVKSRLLAAPTPPAVTTICDVQGAPGDGCYQQPFPCYSTQAFWLAGLDANVFTTGCGAGPNGGTDGLHFIFTAGPGSTVPTPGTLTEFPNGTATLTGHLESTIFPGRGYNVNITFVNFTATPDPMGPLKELNPSCYGTGPGQVDISTWHYYQTVNTATLTGTGNYAGAVVQLTPVMHFPEFGNGASGKNVMNGASGWFTWTVTQQPSNTGFHLNTNPPAGFQGDFNINCTNPHQPGCQGTIGDFVWQDTNGNGCQDAGEPGIQGVQVDLFSGCGAGKTFVTSQTTDANGHYLFNNLCAGNYTICFHTPNGFTPTGVESACGVNSNLKDSNCSATDCNICVNLPTDNSSDTTIDCGYIPHCAGTIGDFVWQDNNSNGCQDNGEPGIQGVQVDLFSGCGGSRSATPIATQMTDANGHYLFTNLCAGNYTVCFHTPTGFMSTIHQSASCNGGVNPNLLDSDCSATDCNICVNLPTDNSSDITIDCGYVPTNRGDCMGVIGDFVWQDLNGNGCQDAGEPGMQGVTVDIFMGCGDSKTQIGTTTTGANGQYLFSDLCAGTYTICFHTPTGFNPTQVGASCGANSTGNDSNCSAQDCNICVTLPANDTINRTIDCGYLSTCPLTVTKTCAAPTATPGAFNCSNMKPISSISMIWNGSQTINIKAWRGTPGSVLLSTQNGITPGQKVTVSGYTGTPNDVQWEIFDAGTGSKIGTSDFHLSCSDVDMNGPEDCGKAEGDAKGLTGFINQWIFAGMSGANGITIDCGSGSSGGSTNCVITPGPMPDCTSAGKPTSLTFQYTGGGCGSSNNPQSGKFTCSGSVNTALPITVSNSNGYTQSTTTVSPGGFITFSKNSFAAQSGFTLTNSGGTENLSIHTSCSQILAVGNVFGNLTLVGFNGKSGGSQINYHYTVKNNGGTTLNNVVLTDDKLGQIAGPFSLMAGETKSFDMTAMITQTTTNIATATVQGGNCSSSSAAVTVTSGNSPTPTPTPTATPTATPQTVDCTTNGKPNKLTMTYTGHSCASSMNSQGPPKFSPCQKFCCTESNGGLVGASTAHIIVSSTATTPTGTSQRFFEGDVAPNGQFNVLAGSKGFG
ncbi:MAG TPA: SdrD B-like domain-containing protein, partial [Chthoniobacterales bacterium]